MIERVILHAGTPKTGTTAAQVFFGRRRSELLSHGVYYPKTPETPLSKPKHQWMVGALQRGDDAFFVETESRLAQAPPEARTAVFSTEGLFNHWWDFSSSGRAALAALGRHAPTEIWVWFRDPVEFVRSNYVQMLKNSRVNVDCYGRDWSVERMIEDPWFVRHLDYIGFVREVEDVLGRRAVRPFAYRNDTVSQFLQALGVPEMGGDAMREHSTLGDFGVEVLRALNRRVFDQGAKQRFVDQITDLDQALGPASGPLTLAPQTVDRIRALARDSVEALARDYGLHL